MSPRPLAPFSRLSGKCHSCVFFSPSALGGGGGLFSFLEADVESEQAEGSDWVEEGHSFLLQPFLGRLLTKTAMPIFVFLRVMVCCGAQYGNFHHTPILIQRERKRERERAFNPLDRYVG